MAPADSTEVQCFGILTLLHEMLLGAKEQKELVDKDLKDKARRAKEHRLQAQLELARAGSLSTAGTWSTATTATSGQSPRNKWQRAVQAVRKKFDEEREALRLSPKTKVEEPSSTRKFKATTLPKLTRVFSQEGHGLRRAGSLESQESSIRSKQRGLLRSSSTIHPVELIAAGPRKVRNGVRRLRSNIDRSLAP